MSNREKELVPDGVINERKDELSLKRLAAVSVNDDGALAPLEMQHLKYSLLVVPLLSLLDPGSAL